MHVQCGLRLAVHPLQAGWLPSAELWLGPIPHRRHPIDLLVHMLPSESFLLPCLLTIRQPAVSKVSHLISNWRHLACEGV